VKTAIYLTFTLLSAPLFAAGENGFTYLALGDSVPFGMNVTLLPPYSNVKPTQSEFVGYPETVAQIDRLFGLTSLVNAACPGETSGSFMNTTVVDNGCNSPHYQPPAPTIPPFKTTYGLHVNYTEAQMAFADSQLQTDKNIKLVTLSIGANDILLALPALEACGTNAACAQGVLTPVLETYGANLAQILGNIRAQYQGMLILLTYYSPAPALDTVTQALNSAMTQVAAQFPNITLADGYATFHTASAPFSDNACTAGLLIKLPPGPYTTTPCDVHPSPLGRALLAATVEFAALSVK
jgi:lysophospholipase L1-like esterase